MNACGLECYIYTFADDLFLEVAFATFSSSIKEIDWGKKRFFDKKRRCFEAKLTAFYWILTTMTLDQLNKVYHQIDSLFGIIQYSKLSIFRKPWLYCNAEFSQIFTGEMIDNLTEQESDLFETCYILEGICSSCGEDLFERVTMEKLCAYTIKTNCKKISKIDSYECAIE